MASTSAKNATDNGQTSEKSGRSFLGRLSARLFRAPRPRTAQRKADAVDDTDMSGLMIAGLDAAPAGIVLFSAEGEVCFKNKQFEQLRNNNERLFDENLGEGDADTQAKSLFSLVTQKIADQEASTQGETSPETRSVRLSWDDRSFQVKIGPADRQDGERIGFLLDLYDVTQEVRLEANVSELIENFKNGDIYSRVDVSVNAEVVRNPFLINVSKDLNSLLDVFCELFSDIEGSVQAMVAGDVTFKISGVYHGEFETLKDNLNESIANFERTIRGIDSVANAVNSATHGASAISSELKSHAERQQVAVAEAISALSEITTLIRKTAQNAERAAELSDETAKRAQRGQEIVDASVDAMRSIRESSSKIADTITIIESIAFQTNLLALNAAVEAARAGEAGRGFSVVAQEVCQLAQRSSDAARSIQDLIKESNERVARGSDLFSQTDEALSAIADAVSETNQNVAHITESTREQTSSAETIVQLMAAIEDVIEKNANISLKNGEVADKLTSSADELRQTIDYFQLSDEEPSFDNADDMSNDFTEGFDDALSA